jgi:hypothetical protein
MHLMSHPPVEELETAGAPSPWTPKDPAGKEAVREQLGRILSSVLFRNSKRFPAFLRYTVEHALSSTQPLKERTIGHEVFGRDPGYDTGQDPVVRMTATEVRKRLTQYYQLAEHAAEPVITYQPGSYVPEFFAPPRRQFPDAAPTRPVTAEPPALSPMPRRWKRRWSGAALATAASALLVWAFVAAKGANFGSRDAVARFWSPILASSSPVLICIGDPSRGRQGGEVAVDPASPKSDDLTISEFLRANSVRYTDSVTLALLAGELRVRGKPFRIRRPAATELKDLREGPVLLIGGFNNPWTLKLSEGLRFTLAEDDGGRSYIRDRDHPDDRQWQPGDSKQLLKDLEQTYGLITRVQDPATGHSVLTVSGLVLGTRAAGECLIDAECLESAERLGPGDWSTRNLQIVVSAAVIGEDAGAPRVVALHSW